MPISNWPYSNTQQLNLDWILQVVKQFEDDYSGIEAALNSAIQSINQKTGTSITVLEAEKNQILNAIVAAREAAVSDVTTAKTAAIGEIDTEADASVARLQALIADLPADTAELLASIVLLADERHLINIANYEQLTCSVSSTNTLQRSASKYKSRQIPRETMWDSIEITANSTQGTHVTFVTEALPALPTNGQDMSGALCSGETGRHVLEPSQRLKLHIPSDCQYIVICTVSNNNDANPTSVYVLPKIGTDIVDLTQLVRGNIALSDIAQYGNNGVFAPSGNTDLTFSVILPYIGDDRNLVFHCRAKYTQAQNVTRVPLIRFVTGSGLNTSGDFEIGGKNKMVSKQWRVPRYPKDSTPLVVSFTIPVGVTCTIDDIHNTYTDDYDRKLYAPRINAHRRFPMTPYDTMPGVEMAIKAGAGAMIEIPKRLSDGTWIFYHDDTLVYNDTYIRQADGTELPSTYNGTPWSSISYSTAASWDWGISKGALFAGTKPMTMAEFFMVCGKTGINPMLSIHPWPSSSELAEIKAIARKCGVLNKLGIKTVASHITEAYSVFGNDIESYTLDVTSGAQTAQAISAAITIMDGLTGCEVRRVIELFASTAYNAYFGSTSYNAFESITGAGYEAAIAQQNGEYHPTAPNNSTPFISPTDFEYWRTKGVTEYTYEYFWSYGLNW